MIADESTARVANLYNLKADIPFDGSTYSNIVKEDIDLFAAHLTRRNGRICDVGSGLGFHLLEMAQRGLNVYGIDLSGKSVSKSRDRLGAHIPRGHLICGDVREWGVQGFFDGVLCTFPCLGEFGAEGDRRFVSALANILAPGGMLFLKALVRERVHEVVGRFDVTYDRMAPSVTVSAAFDECPQILRVCLSSPGHQPILEDMRLYSIAEISELLGVSELTNLEVITSARGRNGLSEENLAGCAVFLASRGQHNAN